MLDRAAGILSTRDGATVAWEIEPSAPVARLGTRIVQEACSRVSREVGDGTTTTAILAHAMLREGRKWLAAGISSSSLAAEMRTIGDRVVDRLDELCVPVEDADVLSEIAAVASGGDVGVARAIVDALDLVGTAGMIVVEEGKGRAVEIVRKTGMEIEGGLASSDLAGPEGARRLDLPLVALVDAVLDSLEDVRTLLEEATQFPHPLVIVARGCHGKALQTLLANDRKLKTGGRPFEVIAVTVAGHQDRVRALLEDLAALTGATLVDPAVVSLDKFRSEVFGSAQEVSATHRSSSTFVAFDDAGPRIEGRVARLRREVEESSGHDAEMLRTRIAKLTDGFCVMRVGGASQAEMRERRGKVEDALGAVRAAVEYGIVPGAGNAYLALATRLEKTEPPGAGRSVLCEAFREPVRVLARNAGAEPEVVLRRVLEASGQTGAVGWEAGWDATTDRVRDLRQVPALCDPYAVAKAAILASISATSTMLTAEISITKTRRSR